MGGRAAQLMPSPLDANGHDFTGVPLNARAQGKVPADGVTSALAAIQTLVARAKTRDGSATKIDFPAGRYYLSTSYAFTVDVEMCTGAVFVLAPGAVLTFSAGFHAAPSSGKHFESADDAPVSFASIDCAYPTWFGAVQGDAAGVDNTLAFKQTIYSVSSRLGGVGAWLANGNVRIPHGIWAITVGAIPVVSGLRITGAASSYRRGTRIYLNGTNTSVFDIGEGVNAPSMEHMTMQASSKTGTIAINMHGSAGAGRGSADLNFECLTAIGFDRTYVINGEDVPSPGDPPIWQCDKSSMRQCHAIECNVGWYFNSRNADYWHLDSCNCSAADAVLYMASGGNVHMNNCAASGDPLTTTFVRVAGPTNPCTFTSCQAEGIKDWFRLASDPGLPWELPAEYQNPWVFVSCVFDAPVRFEATCAAVFIGGTVNSDVYATAADVRITTVGLTEFAAKFHADGSNSKITDASAPLVARGAQVPDSTANDVATLRANFNTLLTSLRASGAIAT